MTLKNIIPNNIYNRAILMYKSIDLSSSGHTGKSTANNTPIIIKIRKKFLYFEP